MRTTALLLTLWCGLTTPTPSAADGGTRLVTGSTELGVIYVADALRNLHGGLGPGSAFLDYLELSMAVDAGRVFGAGDLSLFASLVHTNAATFSERYVGDAMIVSNIDTDRALRVLEAWFDLRFEAAGRGSVRFGLYDLNSEFDTTPSRGLFLNSGYGIGQELAQTGRNGPSIYPVTALAARVAWAPAERWLLKLAVLDGVPGDPGNGHRSRWHVSESEGALWIGEVTTAAGPLAQLSLGHWRYDDGFERLATTSAGPATDRNNVGTYVTAEFAPRDRGAAGTARWRAFIRAGEANGRINVFERHLAGGVLFDCPWPTGSGSQLGLAAAEARVGADYRAVRRRSGVPVGRYERNVELTWRIPVGSHLVLQPDLQYVDNPGTERRIPDAWVAGLRFELAFSR